jgi:hypothetical protein
VKSAVVWVKAENADFLISPTTRNTLPIAHSMLGYCIERQKVIVTEDPANHEAFDIDFDLPLLRGATAMVLIPIASESADQLAVLQFIDLFDASGNCLSFSEYDIGIFKSIRKMLKRSFFADFDRRYDFHHLNVLNAWSNLKKMYTLAGAADQLCQFLKRFIQCDAVDIFQFFVRTRKIKHLKNGIEYSDLSGGASYLAALQNRPIFICHALAKRMNGAPIDMHLANCSVLSRLYSVGHKSYVFTLRSKWNSQAFGPEDLSDLTDAANLLCQTLILAETVENRTKENKAALLIKQIQAATYETLVCFAANPGKTWDIIASAAKQIFACDHCFIAVYHNMEMVFLPTSVKWKFDCCIAGECYNFREDTFYDKSPKTGNEGTVYAALGVDCDHSAAFHLTVDGKVKGAIELINPNQLNFEPQSKGCFANLVRLLLKHLHVF